MFGFSPDARTNNCSGEVDWRDEASKASGSRGDELKVNSVYASPPINSRAVRPKRHFLKVIYPDVIWVEFIYECRRF